MGMKRIYRCDICEEQIPNESLEDAFGIHFNGMKTFTIGGYGCTDGKHICNECAKQLYKCFESIFKKKEK